MHSPALTSTNAVHRNEAREICEFRAWCRHAKWSRRNKLEPLLELAMTPWHSTRSIFRASRAYAPLVSERFGVPRSRQVVQLAWARLRYGLDATSYYRFQLFRPERWRLAERYLQTRDTSLVLRWLVKKTAGYPRVFGDKRAFEAWCTEHGLPTVPTLVEAEGGRVLRAPSGGLPPIDLFSKPANSQGGDGAARWTHAGNGRWLGGDGLSYDREALLAEIARMSSGAGRPILLQPVLRNAASLGCLTPGGLCTARVVTMRRPGGEPELLYAVYRMPVGQSVADNFDQGGLAAPIDLASGRLGAAVRKHPGYLAAPIERHPATGAAIEGHQLPHWAEVRSLVLKGHRAIAWKGVPFIGWDVALLDDGPVLLEGNNIPCSTLAQMPSGVPLGETGFVSCLNAHIRERFPNL